MLTGPVSLDSNTGGINHMVVFQFVADQGRWVYINPPLTQRNLTPTIFKSQKLHEKSEFKIYSLQGIGPKYQRTTDG